MNEWTDRQAGFAALAVIVGIATFLLLIIASIIAYSTTWGYGIHF